MQTSIKRYAPALVALHWLMALMLIALLVAGHFITAATPNSSPEKIDHLKGHMMVGMSVGLLLTVRLIIRMLSKKPEPASSGMPWADKLARLMHILFYILIFLQVGAGMAMSIGANLPDIVFNGNGSLPTNFWSLPTRGMHSAIALVLAGVICLHAGAALYHQFVLKDGLLARMWFGKRS